MPVVLLITSNDGKTLELPIFDKCVIGRSSRCDFTLNDSQMSSKHGIFELDHNNGILFYSDLGSTNGSFLNNNQITKIQFKINETLRLGNTNITIDEKRLNSRERVSIGRGKIENNNFLIIPALKDKDKDKESQTLDNKSADNIKPKQTIFFAKDSKEKALPTNPIANKKENLIEQEESSGLTKMLKLEVKKKK